MGLPAAGLAGGCGVGQFVWGRAVCVGWGVVRLYVVLFERSKGDTGGAPFVTWVLATGLAGGYIGVVLVQGT
jgi:hypothetical protein